MKKKSILMLAILALFLSLPPQTLMAQSDSAKIQNMLENSMAKQTILTDDDVRAYLEHAESIYLLRFDPSKADEVIKETGWSEGRFAYITTKMAVGMSILMRPDASRNSSIPEFARPSGAELSVIRRFQEDLARTMEAVQARHAPDAAGGGSRS